MTTTILTARSRQPAATQRLAASSVALVPSWYARSLRPGQARVSRLASVTRSGGDR